MARNVFNCSNVCDERGNPTDPNNKEVKGGIRCVRMVDYCDGGSYTWTVPTGVSRVTIEAWGGGGGGSARCCCDCYHHGHGGSGGGYVAISTDTVAGCSYTVCVGRGGMEDIVGKGCRHWCCNGKDGEKSYVTGYNLCNFCADGGGMADGNGNGCYAHCGCMSNSPGCGTCGDAYGNGAAGGQTGYSDAQYYSIGWAGGAAFTAGTLFMPHNHCMRCCPGNSGMMPGGGGTGPRNYNCCCYQAGTGATGLVRIRFE